MSRSTSLFPIKILRFDISNIWLLILAWVFMLVIFDFLRSRSLVVSDLRSERFPVRFQLLAMCRSELSAVIAQLMSKCRHIEIAVPFPCCLVNRECSWKKIQIEKKNVEQQYLEIIVYLLPLPTPRKIFSRLSLFINNAGDIFLCKASIGHNCHLYGLKRGFQTCSGPKMLMFLANFLNETSYAD